MKETYFLTVLSDAESNCSKESIDPNDEVRKVMNHGEELIVITPTAHDEIGDEGVAIAATIYDCFLYAIRITITNTLPTDVDHHKEEKIPASVSKVDDFWDHGGYKVNGHLLLLHLLSNFLTSFCT